MASVNLVVLVGHLGKDPEVRYLANGDAVANLSVATTESWKDKSGERQEKTEWNRVVLYAKLAEIAGEYLKKGSLAYFEGKLSTRKWRDKGDVERYTTEVIARKLTMLGEKSRGSGGGESRPANKPAPAQKNASTGSQGARFDDMDDDIPF